MDNISNRQTDLDCGCRKGLVSVIIPTYNRASLLVDALDSIRKQTYRPIEAVVVDDGSDDDTEAVVQRFSDSVNDDEDFEVTFLKQKHSGAQAARNLGLAKSRGQYIQFLDSDDVLLPRKTEWGVGKLESSGADLVHFYTQHVDQNLQPYQNPVIGELAKGTIDDILATLWHTSGSLFRKELLDKVDPWLESLNQSQQWEYAARIKMTSPDMVFIPRIASYFRSHDGARVTTSTPVDNKINSLELAIDNMVKTAVELGVMNSGLARKFQRRYMTAASNYLFIGCPQECFRCLEKLLEMRVNRKFIWWMAWTCLKLKSRFLLWAIGLLLRLRRALLDFINKCKYRTLPSK